jgi:hypothetical protein
MFGAVVSVEPVTATLPVAPGSVHSGVPLSGGGAVGQVLAAAGGGGAAGLWVWVTENGSATAVEDVVADEAAESESESEPQAASVVTSNAPLAARTTEEDTREKFTVVTLQSRDTAPADRSLSVDSQQNWYSTSQ